MKARRAVAQPKHVHLIAKGARTARLCGAKGGAFIRLNQEGVAYLRRFLRVRGKLCNECTIVAARDHGLILAWSAQLQGKFR